MIIALVLVLGAMSSVAMANEAEQMLLDLDYMAADYMFIAEFLNGYFEEGGSPSPSAIYQNSLWMMYYGDYSGYLTNVNEYGFETYQIPADVYENELVFTYFARTDAILDRLHTADFYKTDKDEPYYELEIGGGFGGPLPSAVMQSYKIREDGLCEAYAYVINPIDYGYYTPVEGDVEGEDYLVVWDTIYTYDEETDDYSVGYGYICAEVLYGLKMVVDLDNEYGYAATYHAFHMIDKNDVPKGDDVITSDEEDVAYVNVGNMNMEAIVEIDRNVFEPGTVFFGEEYYNDEETVSEEYNETAETLKDYGSLAGVYEFSAMKDGEYVQPNSKVSVKFMLPNNFSPECTVYYIAEDGTVEPLDTVIETGFDETTGEVGGMMAVAELEHFSRYAVAGTLFGDVDENKKVNLSDVSSMLKSIAKWDIDLNSSAADANRDGIMNISDVTLVLKYLAGWNVQFGMKYTVAE